MAFPVYRLPPEVERGMVGGPTYQNVIAEAVSGTEQRVRVWAKCRGEWQLSYTILGNEEMNTTFRAVVALFRAHFANLYPFPFKDWGDYQLDDDWIGNGDGTTTAFQIVKVYDPSEILLGTQGALIYMREIYLPRPGLVVKVNGVTQTLTTHYTVSATGLITFVTAPASGHAVTVTGEFDVPVRFNTNRLDLTINENSIAEIGSLPIREVIGTAELA
jgi:uncharacterized protein (TIGR02217 family)